MGDDSFGMAREIYGARGDDDDVLRELRSR